MTRSETPPLFSATSARGDKSNCTRFAPMMATIVESLNSAPTIAPTSSLRDGGRGRCRGRQSWRPTVAPARRSALPRGSSASDAGSSAIGAARRPARAALRLGGARRRARAARPRAGPERAAPRASGFRRTRRQAGTRSLPSGTTSGCAETLACAAQSAATAMSFRSCQGPVGSTPLIHER